VVAGNTRKKFGRILRGNACLGQYPEATHLDIGPGDGRTSLALSNLVGASRTILVDKENHLNAEVKSNPKMTFMASDLKVISALGVDENISFVTVIAALHHVDFGMSRIDSMRAMAQAITDACGQKGRKRPGVPDDHLSGGSVLLLRDHDIRTNSDLRNVILAHMLYEVNELPKGMTRDEFYKWMDDYPAAHDGAYMSMDDMLKLFTDLGWRIFKTEMHPGANPQKLYNALLVYGPEGHNAWKCDLE